MDTKGSRLVAAQTPFRSANPVVKKQAKGGGATVEKDPENNGPATKKQPRREKTRFAGVYSRKLVNRNTGRQDTAFDITYRDGQGKKVWQLIGYASDGVNASFANQKRGAILDGITKGEKPKRAGGRQGMTFAQGWELFAEKWLPNLARPDDEKKRYKWYLEERLGHRRLDAVTLLDLEDLKRDLLQRLSPATVRLALGDVRRVYRKLAAWGLYDGPLPTDGLALPKPDNARTRYLTGEEAVRLLAELAGRSRTWHDIAFLSLHTGMRKGEVLGLRGEHLDFGGRRILVKDAKSGSRTVHMTEEIRELLERIRPDSPADYVFRKRGGGGQERLAIDNNTSFDRAVAECKLNEGISDRRHKVVFHTLRHTYCSWLAISGVPLFTIGELVGHSSVEMTRRYSHLCPDAKQEAASRIGGLMRQAKEKGLTGGQAGERTTAMRTTADHESSADGIQDIYE
ncbi:site-specific integrase [Desulfovibrio sp. OttesenSCG-928-G11]|nr:site-specific integrase [Desulfovibrio sp. OttesenSCG-928-G11]